MLVAVAVTLFLLTGAKSCEYAFLENMPFETEYGVSGMVREREKAFRPAYTRLNIAGTLLCLLSVLPVFATLTSTDLERVLAVCLLPLLNALRAFDLAAFRAALWQEGALLLALAAAAVLLWLPAGWKLEQGSLVICRGLAARRTLRL